MTRRVRADLIDSGTISTQRSTSEVHRLKNVTAQAQEILRSRDGPSLLNDLLDPAGRGVMIAMRSLM
jgi:hypothetical protein